VKIREGANTGPPQKQSFCGAKTPSLKSLPPSPFEERGIKGVRLVTTKDVEGLYG
jgi:hypothetical protein